MLYKDITGLSSLHQLAYILFLIKNHKIKKDQKMDLLRFQNISVSFVVPFALKCAAELEISDRIHAYKGHAMPLNELALSIPITPEKAPKLGQVMRLLVQQGVFAQSEEGYMLTPISELMLSKGSSLGDYVRFTTDSQLVGSYFIMADWFKSNSMDTMYQMKNEGNTLWESATENPKLDNLINKAMASQSRKLMKDVVTSCPQVFEGLKSLVDVGGGTGATIEAVAETFPQLKCTVFDLPHVISNVPKGKPFDAVGGDMFEKVPAADAIMLKNVLHDWPDEDCVKILKRCREAISGIEVENGTGKLIIIELTIDLETHNQMAIQTSLCYNLNMLAAFNSKERTRKEWHNLFEAAGFVNSKVHVVGVFTVYELFL